MTNKYLEKLAGTLTEQRRFDRYISEKPDYQGKWFDNIVTGSGLGAGAVMAPGVLNVMRNSRTEQELFHNLAEHPFKVWDTQKPKVIKAVGIGAALGGAYGFARHAIPARNHYHGYSDVPGVREYAIEEVSPIMGKAGGAAAGGFAAKELGKHLPWLQGQRRVGFNLAGAIGGAKIGEELSGSYNRYLRNRLREKYYE